MVLLFRKLLIRIGKFLPFLFVFIVLIGYVENVYAVYFDIIRTDIDGQPYLYTPITNFIADFIYIDWIDITMLYVICIALELCWKTFLCVHLLVANLAVRYVVEHVYIQYG